MRVDALLAFVPINGNLSLVAAAGVDIPSTNVIDFLGLGVGVVAPNADSGYPIIGTPTTFGAPDAMGVGGMRPELNVTIGTALATATAATLSVAFQLATDDGTGNPGTWNTIAQSGEITAAQGVANTTIARFPWLPPFPETLRPRFARLLFQVPAATLFTAGTIASALVTTVRDDWFQKYAAKNYNVGGING